MKRTASKMKNNAITFLIVCFLFLPNKIEAFMIPAPIMNTMLGGIAGGIGAISVYPIDFVKTQLQTETGRIKYNKGVIDTFIQIIKEEGGFFGLYRGAWVQLIGVTPEKAIKLSVNDMARTMILSSINSGSLPLPTVFGEMMAGGIAGACQVIITNPLEVTKVALQTSTLSFKDIWNEIGGLGLKGLYRGADACLLRDVSFSLILFPLYSHSKEFVPQLLEDQFHLNLPFPIVLAFSGALAGAPAAYFTTPFDIIKTRQQSFSEDESEIELDRNRNEQKKLLLNRDVKKYQIRDNNYKLQEFDAPNKNREMYLTMKVNDEKDSTESILSVISKPQSYNSFKEQTCTQNMELTYDDDLPDLTTTMDTFDKIDLDTVKYSSREMNALGVAKKLLSTDHPSVFFSGGLERVARSAPQFAVTLATFDLLKTFAVNHGFM